jgi:hypothetical protein
VDALWQTPNIDVVLRAEERILRERWEMSEALQTCKLDTLLCQSFKYLKGSGFKPAKALLVVCVVAIDSGPHVIWEEAATELAEEQRELGSIAETKKFVPVAVIKLFQPSRIGV